MSKSLSTAFMEAKKAGEVLVKALQNPKQNLSVADAASASGLSLRDAERGLHYLVSEYRGHLSATQKGELLFRFPTAFTKPWQTTEALSALWQKVKKVSLGVAKFVVRAWISIVMVAYVAIFAAILIALSFANRSDRDDRGSSFGGTLLLHSLLRVILDSLFWTFHPFSPFYVGNRDPYARARKKADVPFYDKVNRFFFGPEKAPVDPLEIQRRAIQEIRAQKGRVGLSDIMRVTGLPKDQADPLLAKLMLDYDGEVSVSERGGIVYVFSEIRKTTSTEEVRGSEPIWARREVLPPLTGNRAGSNLMIAGLNGFNWIMSVVAISQGWTIAKLQYLFTAGSYYQAYGVMPLAPMDSAPLLLGWIPFWFSTALFALPLFRYLMRGREQAKVENENGRRGLLWAVLNRLTKRGIREETLKSAWKQAAGKEPSERVLVREVIKLGGELEVKDEGSAAYRFPELESEVEALEQERVGARESEKEVGHVVFSSST